MELPGELGTALAAPALRVVRHGPAPGAFNMAVDEALLQSARSGHVTLRFYAWRPACLSLGRNQVARGRFREDEARRRGIDIVRRPTGGRAVYHDRELTYSVSAPADLWGSLPDSYRRINRALTAGLVALGVPASLAPASDFVPRPTTRACFRDPLEDEIMAGGAKLVGSAQWRAEGGLLQHGSLLLHDDQKVVRELRVSPLPSFRAAGLSDFLDQLPAPDEMIERLGQAVGQEFGLVTCYEELTPVEREAAARLETRYRSPEWTWRR
ncbi:MAG: lipoate--protein ligase family protein [Gemmatimonadota bacterium]